MSLWTALLIAGPFGLFALAVVAIALWERRRAADREREAYGLGFQRVETPDAGLVERIVALHAHQGRRALELHHVFERRGSDHTLVLFNLKDPDSDDAWVHDGAVAVISSRLSLPAFALAPRIPGEGRLAGWSNRVLTWFSARGRSEVTFPEHPPFDRRYLVVGDHEPAVRAFLTDDRLRALAGTTHWTILADGQLFVFDLTRLAPAHRPSRVPARERVDGALRALQIFLPR